MRNSPVMTGNMQNLSVMTASMQNSQVIKDDRYMSHIGHRNIGHHITSLSFPKTTTFRVPVKSIGCTEIIRQKLNCRKEIAQFCFRDH